MGGGGSKTTIDQGLANQQYANIMGDSQATRNHVDAGRSEAWAQQDNIINHVNAGRNEGWQQQNNILGRIDVGRNESAAQTGQIIGTVNAGRNEATNYFNNLATRADKGRQTTLDVGTNLSNQMGAGFTGVNKGLETLGGSVNSGFASVNNQVGDLRNQVGTGFTNVTNTVNKGVEGINANTNARFDAQGRQITTGFDDTAKRLDTVQTNVLGGQNAIRTLVEQYGGNLDRYYADLSRGQTDAAQRLGGLQTDLTAFSKDQQKANTMATQRQTELANSVAGGFDAMRESFGKTADTLSRTAGQMGQGFAGVNQALNTQNQATTQNFANVARNLQQGFTDSSAQGQAARLEFINKLNTVRNVLSDQTANLDQATRTQFAEISSAFDENGQLISNAVDQQGVEINRAIDGQGNLLISKLDRTSGQISQQGIDLNSALNQVDRAVQRGNSGIMTAVGDFQRSADRDFANIARQLTTGFDDGTQETQAAKQEFLSSINTVKNLLNDQNLQLEGTIRDQFADLSGAFDDTGKLITRSVDANGLQTARAIDSNGRLLLAKFDQNGNRVSQQALDINKMMKALSSSGFLAGSNSSMGASSPTSQAGQLVSSVAAPAYEGIMSPYAISR